MPRISVHGDHLTRDGKPWRAFGYNWGAGTRYPILRYFDRPSAARLDALVAEMRTARRLGANSLRIPLELHQVMQSPTRPRPVTLRALAALLAAAEREGVYLDITSNVAWRRALSPGWYDRLPEPQRWDVQARLWRHVAGVASRSPAVLCYELTSEPLINLGTPDPSRYYIGDYGGYTFLQVVAAAAGRDPRAVARAWASKLRDAVHSRDDRPVTIGLLPFDSPEFAFSPTNIASAVDMITLHDYPKAGHGGESAGIIRRAAGLGKPVMLGETFILHDEPATRHFLTAAAPYLNGGVLGFFDGRAPGEVDTVERGDRLYVRSLQLMLRLRDHLSRPRHVAERQAARWGR